MTTVGVKELNFVGVRESLCLHYMEARLVSDLVSPLVSHNSLQHRLFICITALQAVKARHHAYGLLFWL